MCILQYQLQKGIFIYKYIPLILQLFLQYYTPTAKYTYFAPILQFCSISHF